MSEPTDPLSWRHLAEVLACMPDSYRKLLADHVPAPGCARCRTCTVPGTGVPSAPWPCPIHKLASLAQDIHDKPLRGRPG